MITDKDLIAELKVVGERLHIQDNRCTAEPMFCVQEKRREYGYDPQWTDDHVWIDTANDCEEVPEPADGEEKDGIVKTGYKDAWHTVMVAFTEKGCKEYLELNGHNHRGEVRIYVESFRRCPEMIAVRKFLIAFAGESPEEAGK